MSLVYFFPEFFGWWYGRGLKDFFNFLGILLSYIYHIFSVKTIFKTFFSPWKRMVEARRPGLDGFRDWFVDNLVSRGVAIVLRTGLLLVFVMAIITFFAASILAAICWVLMPLVLVVLIFMVGNK